MIVFLMISILMFLIIISDYVKSRMRTRMRMKRTRERRSHQVSTQLRHAISCIRHTGLVFKVPMPPVDFMPLIFVFIGSSQSSLRWACANNFLFSVYLCIWHQKKSISKEGYGWFNHRRAWYKKWPKIIEWKKKAILGNLLLEPPTLFSFAFHL